MFAADAELDVGTRGAALFNGDLDELADAFLVETGEGVLGEHFAFHVRIQEAAHVVTADPQRGLRQIVRAEAEELRRVGDFVSSEGATGHFDHRPNLVVDLHLLFLLHFGGHAPDDLHLEIQFALEAHQRNHHLGLHLDALFLHFGGRLKDGARLSFSDFRIGDAQSATAVAQHRVGFVQGGDAVGDLFHGQTELGSEVGLRGCVMRNELMKRRIEQTDGGRMTLERLEDADEVLPLEGQDLGERLLPGFLGVGQDHFADGVNAVALEEHVLGAGQADAVRPEGDGVCGLLGCVCVGADVEAGGLRAPLHEQLEVFELLGLLSALVALDRAGDDFARRGLELAAVDGAAGPVDGQVVTFLEDLPGDGHRFAVVINEHVAGAADAHLAHLTGDECRVGGDAALGGENPLGRDHAAQVFGRSLVADEQHVFLAFVGGQGCAVGVEVDLAGSCPRTGGQTLGKHLGLLDLGEVEDGRQQLVELVGGVAQHCGFPVDELLLEHVHGELQCSGGGTLAVAGLEHEQLAFLDGELDVLHVLEVLFQDRADLHQLGEGLRHFLLETGHGLRSADPCNHVFALGVHEELAVELVLAVGGIAGEGHAGTGGRPRVSVDHRLHVDGRAPGGGDVVLAAVDNRAVVHPGTENGSDCALQLVVNGRGEGFSGAVLDELLEALDDFLLVFSG